MIILLGGTFDPVHKGHINIAKSVLETFKPKQLRFLPCNEHAFSKNIQASKADRLAMLKLAIQNEPPEFCIDDQEIKANGISYTLDTLRRTRTTLSPQESLAFVIGQDAFAQIDKWDEWKHLLDYAHLIVIARNTTFTLAPELVTYVDEHQTQHLEVIKNSPQGKIYFLEMPLIEISSTDIRAALAVNKNPTEDLPENVAEYIQEKKLYLV